MRITIDLQATQTEGSRNRGVGRYSESLARALIDAADPPIDIHVCQNGLYADARQATSRRLLLTATRPLSQSAYHYPAPDRASDDAPGRIRIAEELVRSHWLSTKPDVLHVSHLGEGFVGQAVVPHAWPAVPGGLRSATLYDLIPLRFPDSYLVDPAFRRWYLAQLDVVRQCDLLLAISESTRQDAIELLGVDPDAIRTIWGGIDAAFTAAPVEPIRASDLRHRLGISGRFVLYTGGDDHRKNIRGAIGAFAALAPRVRAGVQLVIVCAMQPASMATYREVARTAGLDQHEVVFTGYVSEPDLVDLYRLCDAFVFPSWYEGFGLPVVEAMACGAPVLGGNHSSIREIIDRDDALFDAKDDRSIADALTRTLIDPGFAASLREHGTRRAAAFTWVRSARLALDAFDDGLARKRTHAAAHVVGWTAKRRLAFFSPLPPCKSGIADHSALLLRHLSRHFEIDLFVDGGYVVSDEALSATFSIHSHERFEEMRGRFDAVMYEFGNSEFHAHMLPILEKYPGIVTLHDAYLSGLFGHLEFNAGDEGRYAREMIEAHGPLARRFFAPISHAEDPVFDSMVELPCTKRVLDQAIGLIAHSPFNAEVSRTFYPHGWRAPFRIVRQLVQAPIPPTPAHRRAIRLRLGFDEDDVIVATFGHVAWNKCGDILLDAFRRSRAGRDRRVRLLYVGACSNNEFGSRLADSIAAHGDRTRIAITGFVDDADFADYLAVVDIAVQLRKNSRGGTPKGVLDCMASGIPVVVNAEASYLDYPDDVLVKLPASFDVPALADTLDRLASDPAQRRERGRAGRAYVIAHHHPVHLAAEYALVINEFIDRQVGIELRSRTGRLADLDIGGLAEPDIETVAAEILRQADLATIRRRRLLIDVSHFDLADHGTGIPRVVRSIVTALYLTRRTDVEAVAIILDAEGKMNVATAMLERLGVSRPAFDDDGAIEVREGDTLLMLDSSWARWSEFEQVHRRIKANGGIVVTAIYDLLPVRLPHLMVEGGPAWFEGWLKAALASSDAVVCISRGVADDVAAFVESTGVRAARELRVGFWHLGADFADAAEGVVSSQLARAFDRPAFLMVGTIEPRKRHGVALDACERLWRTGHDVNLVIIGRPGWLTDQLVERVERHPEAGKRLHFFSGLPDHDLQYAYWHAKALLFPTAGEGFGLPLVEAAHHGLPVIANDLAVLREIGGDFATYVKSDDAAIFGDGIARWLVDDANGLTPDPRSIRYLTWRESAESLLETIVDNRWYRTA